MISFVRTLLTLVTALVLTIILGGLVVIAAALGVPRRPGGIYERLPRLWCRALLWSAGVKVVAHGVERYQDGKPYVFTSNHVSLFDIPALAGALPAHNFLAKSELFRIPFFGPGIRPLGTIPIERENRKAAFGAYNVAAERIKSGSSVVVFPEGTRGTAYPIRPFKKGPFVLAIQAGVPIVPCVVHGTINVLPKKTFRVRPGRVDVHLLEAVPTTGYSYEQRDVLATLVHDRMELAMQSLYLHD
jgi:1-acyl-sn-glycerol-3-phosphate acyltransferase